MHGPRVAVLAVALAGALALGACSDGDGDGGGRGGAADASGTTTTRSNRGTGACETLTPAQARAVVPGAGRGKASGTPEQSAACEWRGRDGAVLRIRFERATGPAAAQVAAAPGDPVPVGDAAKVSQAVGPDGSGPVTLVAAAGEALVRAEATGPRATPERLATAVGEAIAYATR
jgi:hypothetical protein